MTTQEITAGVGAQPSRLVHAYLFSADGKGVRIDEDAALNWLKSPASPASEFIWLHFSNPHHIDTKWLQYVELPLSFKEMLHEEKRSSRFAHSHLGLFAVLNEVPDVEVPDGMPELSTLWLSVRQRWLLSAWDRPYPASAANSIEAVLLTDRLPKRAELGGMRRNLLRLQRLLVPEPAALFRLVDRLPLWVQEEDADHLHLTTENFSLILRDMTGLLERIKLLEDEIVAQVSERTNRNVFILTSVTVLSLPLTIVAALFGMNVGGLPFRNSVFGFWLVLALALVLTSMVLLWIMRFLRD